jgi:hypothetical protein
VPKLTSLDFRLISSTSKLDCSHNPEKPENPEEFPLFPAREPEKPEAPL